MTRHGSRKRLTAVGDGSRDRHGRTAAASALVTSCLAVVEPWKSATTNAASGEAAPR